MLVLKVIRETQNKTTVSYYYTLIRIDNFKVLIIIVSKDKEQMKHSQTDGASISWFTHKSAPKYIPNRNVYINVLEDISNNNILGLGVLGGVSINSKMCK